jgi:TDG/mug DNA glycosylase family protein
MTGSERSEVLQDTLEPDLAVVFVGEAAGLESARVGHYYADSRNSFWKDLQVNQLMPQRLSSWDDRSLPQSSHW